MREFLGTMTGPKVGVYSLRRAQSAHRNASTNPYSPSDSNPSGSRGRSPRGGLHFGRASGIALSRRLPNMAVGVQQHCAKGTAVLLSILREHFAVCQATKPATD
jgi:hypothetical protein